MKKIITAVELFDRYKNNLKLKLADGEQQLIVRVINYAETPEGKEMRKQTEKKKYGELYIDDEEAVKKGIT